MPRSKSFKEDEVLEKAMKLFWKKGYYATSIQDLVDALGINRASLYDTFGGKRCLFDKAITKYQHHHREILKQFLDQQTSVKEGLLALFAINIDQSVHDSENKGCFVVNTTTELIPGDECIANTLIENHRDIENIYRSFLEWGIRTGEISKDTDLDAIAALLYTLNSGIKVIAKVRPQKEYLLSIVKEALTILD